MRTTKGYRLPPRRGTEIREQVQHLVEHLTVEPLAPGGATAWIIGDLGVTGAVAADILRRAVEGGHVGVRGGLLVALG